MKRMACSMQSNYYAVNCKLGIITEYNVKMMNYNVRIRTGSACRKVKNGDENTSFNSGVDINDVYEEIQKVMPNCTVIKMK